MYDEYNVFDEYGNYIGTFRRDRGIDGLAYIIIIPIIWTLGFILYLFITSTAKGVRALINRDWKRAFLNFLIPALIIGFFTYLLTPVFAQSNLDAKVVDAHWQTSVSVEELQVTVYSNEKKNPPPNAYDVSCHDEGHDVCEQKTIDKGNGYSEVVEECHTETEQYCSYTVDEWTVIQTYTLEGNDLRPIYDSPNIASDQRIGNESEDLTVVFSTSDGTETYKPESVSEFQQFTVGSTWTLKMNALGGVLSVEP